MIFIVLLKNQKTNNNCGESEGQRHTGRLGLFFFWHQTLFCGLCILRNVKEVKINFSKKEEKKPSLHLMKCRVICHRGPGS